MNKEKLKQKFIEKGKLVHNNKYDYSKVEYTDSKTKVCIICHEKDEFGEEHGEFWQRPGDHINKKCECPKCALEHRSRLRSSNTKEFIEKAKQIHGDKYDYSKVIYNGAHEKVCIICPEHGEFWMKPNNHLNGQNCPRCALIEQGINRRKTIEQFIKEAKEIHGDKYDYSKVVYTNNQTKIEIICPKHGSFWQTPLTHLRGSGCPECSLENVAKQNLNILDVIIKLK